MKRILAAALALFLAAPAVAQVVPNNLPANTVVGRLGIGSGPAQAIPFAVIGAQLSGTTAITGTGDVTLSGTTAAVVSVLRNLPNDTTLALDLLATNAAAPVAPAAGHARIYVDSTNLVLSSKNELGTVSNTVVPNTASTTQFVTGVNSSGVLQTATIDGQTLKASPASTDEVMIWDVAGSTWKKATVSGIGASSGVSSLGGLTGAITVSGGLACSGSNCTGTTFNGRSGVVVPTSGDYTIAQITNAPFTKSFTSTQQTISNAGSLTLAHGLGAQPSLIQCKLHNTTAESGYSIGDEVPTDVTGTNWGAVTLDATNINIKFLASANGFNITNKSTGASTSITDANWTLICKAWL